MNEVHKYHSMCKTVESVHAAVETQRKIFLLSIKIFHLQNQQMVLSMENVSWIIFGDGCVGHKCMDMSEKPT